MKLRAASDRSLLVTFGAGITAEARRQVAQLTSALHGRRGILNLHPAYASVLVEFDPRLQTHAAIEALVEECAAAALEQPPVAGRLMEIPVCYGAADGPDLDAVSSHTGLSPERVVELHTAAEYEVAFVGFATCFPYLSGLPAELATPRLGAPRSLVPAGSVAIGGAQAGVYPLASPGGWRLIGRTALSLFNPLGEPPALLRMGDRVRFVAEARR